MKKAFTLMEVNLAIMIMAGGILSILGLYGLGYRENRQSRDDVVSAAYADAVLAPLAMALSSTNVTWSSFNKIATGSGGGTIPADGWGAYVDNDGLAIASPNGVARQAWDEVMRAVGSEAGVDTTWPTPPQGMVAGLVIQREAGSGVVRIAFRAARTAADLLTMPLFYTAARYQGKPAAETTGGQAQ